MWEFIIIITEWKPKDLLSIWRRWWNTSSESKSPARSWPKIWTFPQRGSSPSFTRTKISQKTKIWRFLTFFVSSITSIINAPNKRLPPYLSISTRRKKIKSKTSTLLTSWCLRKGKDSEKQWRRGQQRISSGRRISNMLSSDSLWKFRLLPKTLETMKQILLIWVTVLQETMN